MSHTEHEIRLTGMTNILDFSTVRILQREQMLTLMSIVQITHNPSSMLEVMFHTICDSKFK